MKRIYPPSFVIFLWFCIFIKIQSVYASPHPAAGSSLLMNPIKSFYLNKYGFTLSTPTENWVIKEKAPTDSDLVLDLEAPLQAHSAHYSVSLQKLSKNIRLESYTKKWVIDYTHLGFKILGSQIFTHQINNQKWSGYVVDLIKNEQQLRQVIFNKNNNLVVLTCSDSKISFAKNLEKCNEITKSFSWVN